jgi:hypothetical protein
MSGFPGFSPSPDMHQYSTMNPMASMLYNMGQSNPPPLEDPQSATLQAASSSSKKRQGYKFGDMPPSLIPTAMAGDGYDGEILDSLIGGNGFGMEGSGLDSSWSSNANYSGVNSLLSLGLGGLQGGLFHSSQGVGAGAQYLSSLSMNTMPINDMGGYGNSVEGRGQGHSQVGLGHHQPISADGGGVGHAGSNGSGGVGGNGSTGHGAGNGHGHGHGGGSGQTHVHTHVHSGPHHSGASGTHHVAADWAQHGHGPSHSLPNGNPHSHSHSHSHSHQADRTGDGAAWV